MNNPDDERRQDCAGVLRLLLYPVIFSTDLEAQTDRVCQLFRPRPVDELVGIIRATRAELDQPTLAAARIEDLFSKPTEDQVRAYLASVVHQLEVDLALRR